MAFRGNHHSHRGRGRGWTPRGPAMQGGGFTSSAPSAGRGRAQTVPAWMQKAGAAPAPGGASAAPTPSQQPSDMHPTHSTHGRERQTAHMGLPPPPPHPPSQSGVPQFGGAGHPASGPDRRPPRGVHHFGNTAGTNPQPTQDQKIITKAEQRAMAAAQQQSAPMQPTHAPPGAPPSVAVDKAAAEAAAAGVNPDNPWGEFMDGIEQLEEDQGGEAPSKDLGAPVPAPSAAAGPTTAETGSHAKPQPEDDQDDDLFADDDDDNDSPPMHGQMPPHFNGGEHMHPAQQGQYPPPAAPAPYGHQQQQQQHVPHGQQQHPPQFPHPPGAPSTGAGTGAPPKASLLGAPPGAMGGPPRPAFQPPLHNHPPPPGQGFQAPQANSGVPYGYQQASHPAQQAGYPPQQAGYPPQPHAIAPPAASATGTGLPPPPPATSQAPPSSLFSSFGSAPPSSAPSASNVAPAKVVAPPVGGSLLHGLQPSSPATADEVAASRRGGGSAGGGGYPSHPPSEVFVVYAPQIEFNVKLSPLGRSSDPAAAVYPLPFDVAGRIDLAEKKTWWPSREGRLYFSAEPADASIDGHAFKKAAKDLHKRNRAAVVKAGDHEHIWYFVPPKSDLIAEGVVPKSIKAQHKLLVVFGKHTSRKASKKRRRGE